MADRAETFFAPSNFPTSIARETIWDEPWVLEAASMDLTKNSGSSSALTHSACTRSASIISRSSWAHEPALASDAKTLGTPLFNWGITRTSCALNSGQIDSWKSGKLSLVIASRSSTTRFGEAFSRRSDFLEAKKRNMFLESQNDICEKSWSVLKICGG